MNGWAKVVRYVGQAVLESLNNGPQQPKHSTQTSRKGIVMAKKGKKAKKNKKEKKSKKAKNNKKPNKGAIIVDFLDAVKAKMEDDEDWLEELLAGEGKDDCDGDDCDDDGDDCDGDDCDDDGDDCDDDGDDCDGDCDDDGDEEECDDDDDDDDDDDK